jgi:hypothetical protein
LVAKVNIPKGTRIIAEKPLIMALSLPAMESVFIAKTRALSSDEKRFYLSLRNNFPARGQMGGIWKSNVFPCEPQPQFDLTTEAIFSTICLINHDCMPNSFYAWDKFTNTATVHANHDIKAGHEITVSYCSYTSEMSAYQRRNWLMDEFGFYCMCKLCSSPIEQQIISDIRRSQLGRLHKSFSATTLSLNEPRSAMAECQERKQLIEAEYGSHPAQEAHLYSDAFKISIMNGDQARASVFAERAYKAGLLAQGDNHPEGAKMKDCMKRPAVYVTYGTSMNWKTSVSEVPEGLTETKFEEWLWRRSKKRAEPAEPPEPFE